MFLSAAEPNTRHKQFTEFSTIFNFFFQDFPFLRQHKPRKNTIMMENGEMVAVCLDCFDSLRGQFVEAGKYGIPVEKRQYNWMQIPPPPPDSDNSLLTPHERLTKFARPPISLAAPTPKTTTTVTSEGPKASNAAGDRGESLTKLKSAS